MRSLFQIEARFLGFIYKKERCPKRMLVESAGRRHGMKLSKHLREPLGRLLRPGMSLLIRGEQKQDGHELKRKAVMVKLLSQPPSPALTSAPAAAGCVQVCMEDNCCRRGAIQLWQDLESAVTCAGLEGEVAIEGCGCLDNCRNGPSFSCGARKQVFSRLPPPALARLLEKSFRPEKPGKLSMTFGADRR
jgi:hypothetical protein